MQRPSPGQRWISTSEPALGLGLVESIDGDRVIIAFPAAEEIRHYAFGSAPLVRVQFSTGDQIAHRDGRQITITEVEEQENLLTYHSPELTIPEGELLDSLSFIQPEKRLLAGLSDHPRDFDLRHRALEWNSRLRKSPGRGFTGARIDLIPHQLAIVAETANRLHPRVLLADEVGLGKTIEACLILHRLHLTGRADRALILVPEPLVHQWFVEMLRRFNLLFSIYDESRCLAIEAHDETANPFEDAQLILAATDYLTEHPKRAEQARQAGFDILIVDEAHHLEWYEDDPSEAYSTVESLAAEIPSLLLLTATPRQLGPEGHFARLRLLDPGRYNDLDAFLTEADSYTPLAEAVEALTEGKTPASLDAITSSSPRASEHLAALRSGDESARQPLVTELIDSFGTGRVLFRNTRERLSGFPTREPILHPLPAGTSPYLWLAELLKSLGEKKKVLLITSSPDAAIAVQEKLLEQLHVESALFHEDLNLIQRDRNAAWFSEPDGARILICSEIGSEGRNFQFAHHLVLFGLPRDPEVLEQRIGRLDRIGQTETIHIHVPYGVDSSSEIHARWLHEGIDVFSEPLKGATTLATTLLPELDLLQQGENPSKDLPAFLKRSQKLKAEVSHDLATGHDRLLELGAPAADKASDLIDAIETADQDPNFERFVVRLFDHLGLDVTDLSLRSYLFKRGQRHGEAFADLPEDGLSATFDRDTALAREDLSFLTADHPVFRSALEQLIDSEIGNASFAQWKTGQGKAVLLECCFVLESLAPTRLHVDRFLPPTAYRVLVDHRGNDLAGKIAFRQFPLQPGDSRRLVHQDVFRRELFPKMLESARELAKTASQPQVVKARERAIDDLNTEVARLRDLAQRNSQIKQSEIQSMESTLTEIQSALESPRLRLDSLRLIWRT